jgi:hypothetical protein
MTDYGGLISGLVGIVGAQTAPKTPKIDPYEPQLLENRSIDDYAPELKSLVDSQSDIASSLLRGELPKGVVDQIKMFAGEAAQRGGFGSSITRSGNLTARDLGLTALDAMAQGQQYAGFIQNYAADKLNTQMQIDTANANMLYDAWASKANSAIQSYQAEMDRHNATWGAVATGVGSYASNYASNEQRKADRKWYTEQMDKGQAREDARRTEMMNYFSRQRPESTPNSLALGASLYEQYGQLR